MAVPWRDAGLVAGRVPRYVTVGERDPQRRVRVTVHELGPPTDVTYRHVIAAMRPLTIALVPGPGAGAPAGRARLVFSPWDHPDTTLGHVSLRHDGTITGAGLGLQLFRVEGHGMACMPWWAELVFALSHAWTERRHRSTFRMSRRDRMAFAALYICPRPVVLVSVAHEAADNLFPMDLIGPAGGSHVLLALRSTSPSIPLMTSSRRIALADVPLEDAANATRLGDRHRETRIDWDRLPFETDRSPVHGLRVPRGALRIRDLEVRDTREVGSHTLFVTEVVGEERRRDGLQMFTVSGQYYRHLRLRG